LLGSVLYRRKNQQWEEIGSWSGLRYTVRRTLRQTGGQAVTDYRLVVVSKDDTDIRTGSKVERDIF
jgi:hypothetical protein